MLHGDCVDESWTVDTQPGHRPGRRTLPRHGLPMWSQRAERPDSLDHCCPACWSPPAPGQNLGPSQGRAHLASLVELYHLLQSGIPDQHLNPDQRHTSALPDYRRSTDAASPDLTPTPSSCHCRQGISDDQKSTQGSSISSGNIAWSLSYDSSEISCSECGKDDDSADQVSGSKSSTHPSNIDFASNNLPVVYNNQKLKVLKDLEQKCSCGYYTDLFQHRFCNSSEVTDISCDLQERLHKILSKEEELKSRTYLPEDCFDQSTQDSFYLDSRSCRGILQRSALQLLNVKFNKTSGLTGQKNTRPERTIKKRHSRRSSGRKATSKLTVQVYPEDIVDCVDRESFYGHSCTRTVSEEEDIHQCHSNNINVIKGSESIWDRLSFCVDIVQPNRTCKGEVPSERSSLDQLQAVRHWVQCLRFESCLGLCVVPSWRRHQAPCHLSCCCRLLESCLSLLCQAYCPLDQG